MTQFPSPDQDPSPSTPPPVLPHRRRRLLRRSLYTIGGITLVGGLGVAGAGIWFVQNRLAPVVETSLENIINRPVDIGAVEDFSLTHLRFGPSVLPPTETDADTVVLDELVVRFNLLEFLANRTLTLDLDLIRPDLFLDQTEDGAWLDLNLTLDPDARQTIKLDTLTVKDGHIVFQPFPWAQLDEDAPPATDPPPQVVVADVNGGMTLRDNNKLISFELDGKPVNGGVLNLRGQADLNQDALNIVARSNELVAADVARLVRLPLTVLDGTLSTNLVVNLDLNNLPDVRVNGTASINDLATQVVNVPEVMTDGNARLMFRDRQVQIEEGRARYGDIQTLASGTIDLDNGFDLALRVPSVSVAQLEQTFEVASPVAASGSLTAEVDMTGPLQEPQFSGVVRNVGAFEVDRVAFETLGTRFSLNPQRLELRDIQAVPVEGGLITGRGTVQFGETGGLVFDVIAQSLPADQFLTRYGATLPANTIIGAVNGDLQIFGPLNEPNEIQAVLNWSAPQGTYPSEGQVRYADRQIVLREAIAQVAGGTVQASGRASLVDRGWQAIVNAAGVPLNQFSNQLQGVLSANVDLTGSLNNLSPAAIRATGEASFSQGIYLLDRPLDAQFSWLGDRLQIHQATAPGFAADGVVNVALGQPNPVGAIDLNVLWQDFDLQQTQAFLPPSAQAQLAFAGRTDFDGRVTGTGTAPEVAGNLAVRDFAVNQFAFEPLLAGDVAFAWQRGLVLDIEGDRDRIALQLDDRFLPTEFFVQNQDTIAQARTVNNTLVGEVINLDLATLNTPQTEAAGLNELQGILNSDFRADIQNLQNPSLWANVVVIQPGVSFLNFEQFSGQLRYQDRVASLREGELLFGMSRYLLSGLYDPRRDTPFTGEVFADQGDVQDLLVALQFFEIQDFARGLRPPVYADAAAVVPTAIDTTGLSLLDQVRRLSELMALAEQQRQAQEDAVLPPLAELDGQFEGSINLSYGPTQGFAANFNLNGENWQWGDYQVDTVTALGEFEDGILALLPLRLDIDDGFINATGRIGGDQQSAQVIAEQIPVALLKDFVTIPFDLEGMLNANASLSGSIENPQVIGQVAIQDGTLEGTPIQAADLRLNYNNARFNFIGSMTLAQIKANNGEFVVENPDPLRIRGSIPYAFRFMTVEPASENITLSVSVKDDGIALMNVFTDKLAWEGGTGIVELDVEGTLSEPVVDGLVVLNDTIITSPALPEPLTNVNGTIDFNRDRLIVRSLTGDYGAGQIKAGGYLPIAIPSFPAPETVEAQAPNPAEPSPDRAIRNPQTSPLTVVLEDLDIVYQDLFEGEVDGQILLTGAVLAPLIGGEVVVSNGRLFLVQPTPPDSVAQARSSDRPIFLPPQLENLDVVLGNNFRIQRNQPDINFVASGTLTVSGPFDALQPSGTVQLERGYVNIFVTQFNLARPNQEFPQTAVFRPGDGLDPYLNVRLIAVVPELLRPPTITTSDPFAGSETADPVISATNYGALQTVRVQAAVQGPSSRIFEELTLTSEPSRSEPEIVALIGGGTLSALEQGDGTLALANLASTALLSDFQNLVVNVLGLSSFRLYPTEVISERGQSAALGLAAEVGIDITNNLSASLIQVITTDDLTQFGLRYRINDQFSVRGSTTLEGDSRVILEYRSQF